MRVYVHANCQSIAIARILGEVFPDWSITFYEVHGQSIVDNISEYCAGLKSADLILSQPIHSGYRNREDLSLDWIRATKGNHTNLLVIPSVHFSAHHPGLDGLGLDGHPAMSNLILAHLIAEGMATNQAVDCLLSDQLLSFDNINQEINIAIEETKRREQDDSIDIKISPFLAEAGRKRRLFHIHNHPFREVGVVIVNAVLEKLGYKNSASAEGVDHQDGFHIPPLPSISKFLIENGGSETEAGLHDTVQLHGRPPLTQEAYYTELAADLARFDAQTIRAAVERRWPAVNFMRRLAAGESSIPGIGRWHWDNKQNCH